ncbi:MAG: hypothetical protein ACI8RD_004587, partial [Bacillariaceae sp.]
VLVLVAVAVVSPIIDFIILAATVVLLRTKIRWITTFAFRLYFEAPFLVAPYCCSNKNK